jgi:DNA repair exonuclease SbcCD ATPase subunit
VPGIPDHNKFDIVNKGITGHLMKESTKRRKSKIQIQEERKLEEQKQEEIQRKLAEYEQYMPDLETLKKKARRSEELLEEKS